MKLSNTDSLSLFLQKFQWVMGIVHFQVDKHVKQFVNLFNTQVFGSSGNTIAVPWFLRKPSTTHFHGSKCTDLP